MHLKKTPTTRPLLASRSKVKEGVTQCKFAAVPTEIMFFLSHHCAKLASVPKFSYVYFILSSQETVTAEKQLTILYLNVVALPYSSTCSIYR